MLKFMKDLQEVRRVRHNRSRPSRAPAAPRPGDGFLGTGIAEGLPHLPPLRVGPRRERNDAQTPLTRSLLDD